MSTKKQPVHRTPVEHLLFESGKDLKDIKKVGYPTLINFKRGYKLENLRGKIRKKYPVEKGKKGMLFFPSRPNDESPDYWVKKLQESFQIKIEISHTEPIDDKLRNVFFKILTKPKKVQYIPDEPTKKKVAKFFNADPKTIYEDRSEAKD